MERHIYWNLQGMSKHELSEEESTNEKGEKLPEYAIEEKWKAKYKAEVTRNLIKAREASDSESEKSAPITLLSDALKKLDHEDLLIDNIDVSELRDALKLADQINNRGEDLKKRIYKRVKTAERVGMLKQVGKA